MIHPLFPWREITSLFVRLLARRRQFFGRLELFFAGRRQLLRRILRRRLRRRRRRLIAGNRRIAVQSWIIFYRELERIDRRAVIADDAIRRRDAGVLVLGEGVATRPLTPGSPAPGDRRQY